MKEKALPKEFTKARQKRLWKHILRLEEVAGRLRIIPRRLRSRCPISCFLPRTNLPWLVVWVELFGFITNPMSGKLYLIYEESDSAWWYSLPTKTQIHINKWVSQKLRERYKENYESN